MKKLESVLAENMRRFNTKNLSESEIKKYLQEQVLTSLQQFDPGFQKVEQYFVGEYKRKNTAPAIATANLMYIAEPTPDIIKAAKYIINVSKAIGTQVGSKGAFIMPVFMGPLDFFFRDNKFANNNPALSVPVNSWTNDLIVTNDLKQFADVINDAWNKIPSAVAVAHLQGRKATLANSMAKIKAGKDFATYGAMLTGTAKEVYNIIAA